MRLPGGNVDGSDGGGKYSWIQRVLERTVMIIVTHFLQAGALTEDFHARVS